MSAPALLSLAGLYFLAGREGIHGSDGVVKRAYFGDDHVAAVDLACFGAILFGREEELGAAIARALDLVRDAADGADGAVFPDGAGACDIAAAVELAGRESVSYTHLTLPTKA